jgi:hypothetical protein
MLVDIILLILVILVLYKIYINKLKKEHMLSNEDVYMYSKNESRLLGNYYNMINNPSISNREKCINNDKVIAISPASAHVYIRLKSNLLLFERTWFKTIS